MTDRHIFVDLKLLKRSILKNEEGLTQKELAKKIGFDQSYLSRVLSGERRISLIVLRKISEEINVPYYMFLEKDSLNQRIISFLPHLSLDEKLKIVNYLEIKKQFDF